MDPYELLHISRNVDGTLTRPNRFPDSPPTGEHPPTTVDVLSKDLPFKPSFNTYLRLFLPRRSSDTGKLPVLLFFHGGGFVFCSPSTNLNHAFCERLAASLPALIISVNYRLAPEHRLPAAFDDAADALLWLCSQARSPATERDPWIAAHADFGRLFLAGCSAGGNVAYHAALRARGLDLGPINLAGVIMNQPFFGGKERTASELRSGGAESTLPLAAADSLWELSLPEGADRDHEYCNPAAAAAAAYDGVEERVRGLARCLVVGFAGDSLVDRQRELAEMLERGEIPVRIKIHDGGFHGADVFEPRRDQEVYHEIREFVNNGGAAQVAGVQK